MTVAIFLQFQHFNFLKFLLLCHIAFLHLQIYIMFIISYKLLFIIIVIIIIIIIIIVVVAVVVGDGGGVVAVVVVTIIIELTHSKTIRENTCYKSM